jgi:TctA family transporter
VITAERPLKGIVSLLLGLLVASVGLGNPAGFPRFTFGNAELTGGIGFIPMMIGMFAVSEIIRYAVDLDPPLKIVDQPIHNVFRGMWGLLKKYPLQLVRGSALGTLVGALPGAGADIAAWMSYAVSKKTSKEPEKFGTGHVEGIVESGAANNSALAGAWIPALVFGIPGDSITAIVIGVLYMKNMNPGPTLFTQNPQNIYAVYLLFIIANLLMIPLGFLCIKVAKQILRVPRNVLMPVILLFCIVGSFAINNTPFDVGVMVVAGVIAYLLEENGFPVAPAILGVVLGTMFEENFVTSMITGRQPPLFFAVRGGHAGRAHAGRGFSAAYPESACTAGGDQRARWASPLRGIIHRFEPRGRAHRGACLLQRESGDARKLVVGNWKIMAGRGDAHCSAR